MMTPAVTPMQMPAVAPPPRPDDDDDVSEIVKFPSNLKFRMSLVHAGNEPEKSLFEISRALRPEKAPGEEGSMSPTKRLSCNSKLSSSGK